MTLHITTRKILFFPHNRLPFCICFKIIPEHSCSHPLVDENGMVRIKARVNGSNKLFDGMNVRVGVKRSVGEQLVIPKTAVVLRSGKQVVFTLKEGKAMWNYVHTGLENMEEYTITDGLEEGMEVITTGNVNLAHEAPVRVIKN